MSHLSRRDALKVGAALSGALAVSRLAPGLSSSGSAPAFGSPNIVVLVFDAMSAENLSLYGYRRDTSPNLERFASRATVYNAHYSAGSFTTPGTASLLTGLYPWTHRAIDESGLIARAGVAVYRVGAIKKRGGRTWLLTDGGMADNPRHALYASKYTALPVSGASRPMTDLVSIGGPFCESGDVILEDLRLPILGEGELVAVPVSGAYHLSMSSNYNGSRRPAVLWLEKGSARLIVRRETLDDLLQRDLSLT